jgi:RNA polymerase sigma factor (TIGR02999 family)
MPEITDLLRAAQAGQELASRRLFELVYGELRRMAHHRLLAHRPKGEIDTTSLAHETYVRLAEHGPLELPDRRSFYGYVARAMRSVLIDYVRAQRAVKRGGQVAMVTLTTSVEGACIDSEELLTLHDALVQLEHIAPDLHQLVELRYFAGLSVDELAELNGTSTRTVNRDWTKARLFLRRLIDERNTAPA